MRSGCSKVESDRTLILSDNDIKKSLQSGDICIDNCSGEFEPASYDLRVGDRAVTRDGVLSLQPEDNPLEVRRGETAVIYPMERIAIGISFAARFGLISKWARRGLVLLSGPQVDPGFEGSLEITVFNAGNSTIHLGNGEPFATIEFEKLSSPASRPYSGPYQKRGRASCEIVKIVKTRKKNFAEIEEELEELRSEMRVLNAKYETHSAYQKYSLLAVVFTVILTIVVLLVRRVLDWLWQ